jgi:hypothetical protein
MVQRQALKPTTYVPRNKAPGASMAGRRSRTSRASHHSQELKKCKIKFKGRVKRAI